MAIQSVFKRYELKYILTIAQYKELCNVMEEYMAMDEHGRHKISNIYFDTPDYSIIRHSLEKPRYKEKLRMRIYGEPDEDAFAFVELKKKYNGVVSEQSRGGGRHSTVSTFWHARIIFYFILPLFIQISQLRASSHLQ